jgi:hypothetical protein
MDLGHFGEITQAQHTAGPFHSLFCGMTGGKFGFVADFAAILDIGVFCAAQ